MASEDRFRSRCTLGALNINLNLHALVALSALTQIVATSNRIAVKLTLSTKTLFATLP